MFRSFKLNTQKICGIRNFCSSIKDPHYQKFFETSNKLNEISKDLASHIRFNAYINLDYNPKNFKSLVEVVDYAEKYTKLGEIFKKHEQMKKLLNDNELKSFMDEINGNVKNNLIINKEDYNIFLRLFNFYKK